MPEAPKLRQLVVAALVASFAWAGQGAVLDTARRPAQVLGVSETNCTVGGQDVQPGGCPVDIALTETPAPAGLLAPGDTFSRYLTIEHAGTAPLGRLVLAAAAVDASALASHLSVVVHRCIGTDCSARLGPLVLGGDGLVLAGSPALRPGGRDRLELQTTFAAGAPGAAGSPSSVQGASDVLVYTVTAVQQTTRPPRTSR